MPRLLSLHLSFLITLVGCANPMDAPASGADGSGGPGGKADEHCDDDDAYAEWVDGYREALREALSVDEAGRYALDEEGAALLAEVAAERPCAAAGAYEAHFHPFFDALVSPLERRLTDARSALIEELADARDESAAAAAYAAFEDAAAIGEGERRAIDAWAAARPARADGRFAAAFAQRYGEALRPMLHAHGFASVTTLEVARYEVAFELSDAEAGLLAALETGNPRVPSDAAMALWIETMSEVLAAEADEESAPHRAAVLERLAVQRPAPETERSYAAWLAQLYAPAWNEAAAEGVDPRVDEAEAAALAQLAATRPELGEYAAFYGTFAERLGPAIGDGSSVDAAGIAALVHLTAARPCGGTDEDFERAAGLAERLSRLEDPALDAVLEAAQPVECAAVE